MPSFIEVLGYVFGFLFSLWPLIVIVAISWRGRAPYYRKMLAAWMLLFIGWILARFVPAIPSMLIPEPYNTIAFFVVGVTLLILNLTLRQR
jgi:hypothetical protein